MTTDSISKITQLLVLAMLSMNAIAVDSVNSINKHREGLQYIEVLLLEKQYEKALNVITQHEEYLNSSMSEDRVILAYLGNKKGLALSKLGNLCRGALAYRASLNRVADFEQQKPEFVVMNLISLANIYRGLNDRASEAEIIDQFGEILYQGADFSLETTFSIVRAMVLNLVDRGQIGRADRALEELKEALEAFDVADMDGPKAQVALLTAVIQQARGNLEIAHSLYNQAFEYLDVFNKDRPPGLWFELANYARLQHDMGNLDQFEATIDTVETAIRHHRKEPEQLLAGVRLRAQGRKEPVPCEIKTREDPGQRKN